MSDLVKSISIANLLNQVEAIETRLIAARKSIQEAGEICKKARLGELSYIISSRSVCGEHFVTGSMKELQGKAWKLLMYESGLKSFMSAKRREEWKNAISNHEFPQLTTETIAATFRNIHADREKMFERGVIECFQSLSWDYKTNLPCKFGKRIIVKFVRSNCEKIDDLMRVFHILDGEPEPDHRHGIDYQMSEASATKMISNCYIKLRWFKQNTGHITFKRPDLIAALNRILAKHYPNALPCRV